MSVKELSEPEDFVACRICGKKLKLMTPWHLRTHGITTKEYRERWPNAPLSSGYHKKSITLGRARVHLKLQTDGSEPKDFVVCRVCGKKLRRINTAHLYAHNIDFQEYKQKFPDAPTISISSRRKMTNDKNPMRVPGVPEKLWKHRREKDPDNSWYAKMEVTRKQNYPNNEWAYRAQKTRHKNDPEHKWAKRAVKTREARDPNNQWAKQAAKTREERYDWSELTSKAKTEWWKNISPQRREEQLQNSLYKGSKRPNVSEGKLIPMLEPLGFVYNGNGPERIAEHYPDFIHTVLPLVIEFDGTGGHDPDIPHIPGNPLELDNQRDNRYRVAGHKVLRMLPEDLEKGQLHVQQKVIDWMTSLDYSTEWEPFDINEWFE